MSGSDNDAFGLARAVCVVTGAASGIGRATALALAGEGARVAALDRNHQGAEETAQMARALGTEAMGVGCDIADRDAVLAAHSAIRQGLGDAAVLVNNAGIVTPGAIMDTSAEDWAHVIDVNLTGYFHCTQAFGRPMMEKGVGSVIHVGSVTALAPLVNTGCYPVTKAAITMMSQLLSVELGRHGVRSNVVHPGMIETTLTRQNYKDPSVARAREEMVPLQRIGTPDDVAEAVLFLASPRSAYINGAEILVDGGLKQGLFKLP